MVYSNSAMNILTTYPVECDKRVALIRTLAIKPNILLLDEPFSKLDIDSRIKISDDVYKIIKELKLLL